MTTSQAELALISLFICVPPLPFHHHPIFLFPFFALVLRIYPPSWFGYGSHYLNDWHQENPRSWCIRRSLVWGCSPNGGPEMRPNSSRRSSRRGQIHEWKMGSATGSAEGANIEIERMYLASPRQCIVSGSDTIGMRQRRSRS